MKRTTTLKNTINERGVAKAIGKNIQNVFTAIFEITDNSISNLYSVVQKEKIVHVDIKEINSDLVNITIEDNGTGIEDLTAFTSLGDRSKQQTSRNCHGFGVKNVINSLSVKDGTILTRTLDDALNDKFSEIKKKNFTLRNAKVITHTKEKWGGRYNTGTIVSLDIERAMFNSALNMFTRQARKNYRRACAFIFETIGYINSPDIKNGIKILFSAKDEQGHVLAQEIPVCPYDYTLDEEFIPLNERVVEKDFGRGVIKATFRAGIIHDEHARDNGCHVRYTPYSNEVPMLYGRVRSDMRGGNGAILTLNGRRMIERIPVKEVFNRSWHPSLNHLYCSIELEADNPEALPQTTPAKNGYISDCVIENLCIQMRQLYTPSNKDFPALDNTIRTGWELLGLRYKNTHRHDADFAYATDVPVGDSRLPLIVKLPGKTLVYEGEKSLIGRKELYGMLGHYDELVNACNDNLFPRNIKIDINEVQFVVMLSRKPTQQILNAIEDLKEKHNFVVEIEQWHEFDIIY